MRPSRTGHNDEQITQYHTFSPSLLGNKSLTRTVLSSDADAILPLLIIIFVLLLKRQPRKDVQMWPRNVTSQNRSHATNTYNGKATMHHRTICASLLYQFLYLLTLHSFGFKPYVLIFTNFEHGVFR